MSKLLQLLATVGVVLVFASIDGEDTANATFPGANGRLALRLLDSSNIYSMHVDGKSLTLLEENAFRPIWSPDGRKIAYLKDVGGNVELFVMNADGNGKTNLSNAPTTHESPWGWSPDGSRILFKRSNQQGTVVEIWVMNADGSGQTNLALGDGAAWSPDGSKIAFSRQNAIWVMNADGSAQTTISPVGSGFQQPPAWSYDSSRIAFQGAAPAGGGLDIWVVNADGSGLTDVTPSSPNQDLNPIWSPDGSRVYFDRPLSSSQSDIFSVNPDGTGETNVTNWDADDGYPVWSPDGTKIAFIAERHGLPEIFTMNPDGSQQTRIFGVITLSMRVDWQPLPDDADDDNDGLSDATETACGSDPLRDDRRPERVDGPFAGVDDDNDAVVDEPLPAGAANFDCDGDGYRGSAEDHVYSYLSQTNGDQKTCQEYDGAFPNPAAHIRPSLRWPSDLAGGSFSANKINIQDIAAFTNPIRYLNQDVGTNANDLRFDLVPGSTVGADINIVDLAAITSGAAAFPPMLGGLKAFNGPSCPWPP